MSDHLEQLRALVRLDDLRGFLAGLTTDELEAVERFCELIEFGPRVAWRRSGERLSDAGAFAEWRRLCRRGERL